MGRTDFQRFGYARLQIELSQITINKADEPNVVLYFLDADGLTGGNRVEIDFLWARQMRPQWVTLTFQTNCWLVAPPSFADDS